MFELNQQCTLENVLTNNGKNDDSPLLVHMKIRCDALPPEAAAAALRARGTGEAQQAFFSDGKPRFAAVDVIPLDHDYEAKHQITIGSLKQLRATKVFNIRLLPLIEGHFASTFTVTIEDPDAKTLHYLCNAEHTVIDVKLVQDVRELDLQDKPSDEERLPGKVKTTKPAKGEQAPLIN